MNKVSLKEFDKAINELPKTNDIVSAFSNVSVKKLRKAVERFEYVPSFNDLLEENERLNNIINELNNGIKELDNMFYETFRISQNGYYSISEWELKDFIDKLKELKGEQNEKEIKTETVV